jgi:hypothetical protein
MLLEASGIVRTDGDRVQVTDADGLLKFVLD